MTNIRRHDLDALRGMAMLLGIVLHAALAFIPGSEHFWAVSDTQQTDFMRIVLNLIHGFRMPLFFLLSGFFTAMLWQKRGLGRLMVHRVQRIFLPLVLGVVFLTPANFIAAGVLKSWIAQSASKSQETVPAVEDGKASSPSTVMKAPEAWMAAARGDMEALKRWTEQGGDVNARTDDQSIAIHGAILFGRVEAAKFLAEAGSDLQARNVHGARVVDHLGVDWGTTQWVAGMVNLEVKQPEVIAGRKKIASFLSEDFELGEALTIVTHRAQAMESSTWTAVAGLLRFPLFGHLWFLYFLCLLVLGLAAVVSVGKQLGIPRLPRWMTGTASKYIWLVPLTAWLQYAMGGDPANFGPTTSISLLFDVWLLVYYAVFFGFGALHYCHTAAESEDTPVANQQPIGEKWWLLGSVAMLLVYPLNQWLVSQGEWGRIATNLTQAVYAWIMTFAAMGCFRRYCSTPSKAMRYLSDSSYWLYLIHLPLIYFVLYWVRLWEWSPWIKLPIVCLVTSGLLLLSYQLFVRYTPIGWLLNGKRARQNDEPVVKAVVVERA